MKTSYFLFHIILILSTALATADQPEEPIVPEGVIRLFNGRDLTGWTTWLADTKQEDPRDVYSVRDGVLRISGDGFGYLSTGRAYKDYRLVVEVKWGSQNWRTRRGIARDSGIFLHTIGPEGNSYDRGWGIKGRNTGADVSTGAYKAAIECQVMEGGFGDLLLIHGRYADGSDIPVRATVRATPRSAKPDYANYKFDPRADELTLSNAAVAWQHKSPVWQDEPGYRGSRDVESPAGQWTRVECVCTGDRITIHINGHHVNQARNLFPAAGKILLQCEGSEVFFRKIELHPLAADEPHAVYWEQIEKARASYRVAVAKQIRRAKIAEVVLLRFDDLQEGSYDGDEERFPITPYEATTRVIARKELAPSQRKQLLLALAEQIKIPEHDTSVQMMCHLPVHGVSVYSEEPSGIPFDSKLIYSGSFSWCCHNFSFTYPDGTEWLTTNDKLKDIFNKLLPVPKKERDRLEKKHPE